MGWETADQLEKGIVGSSNRKSRDLGWETAGEGEKGIVGSSNRKSRDLEGETADQLEKWIVGSRGSKTAEKTRAQSPKSNFSNGGRYKRVNPRLGSSHDEFLHHSAQ